MSETLSPRKLWALILEQRYGIPAPTLYLLMPRPTWEEMDVEKTEEPTK